MPFLSVYRYVCLCVCLFIGHNVEPDKIAEPIEMPVGMWTLVDPRNHILCGAPDSPWGRGNFGVTPAMRPLIGIFWPHVVDVWNCC